MFQHKNQAIINCTHKLFTFTDPAGVGVACDLNLPPHVAAHISDAIVWSCRLYLATICSGCH